MRIGIPLTALAVASLAAATALAADFGALFKFSTNGNQSSYCVFSRAHVLFENNFSQRTTIRLEDSLGRTPPLEVTLNANSSYKTYALEEAAWSDIRWKNDANATSELRPHHHLDPPIVLSQVGCKNDQSAAIKIKIDKANEFHWNYRTK